jgi:hypothetical protein
VIASRLQVLLSSKDGALRSREFKDRVEWKAVTQKAAITDVVRVHEYNYIAWNPFSKSLTAVTYHTVNIPSRSDFSEFLPGYSSSARSSARTRPLPPPPRARAASRRSRTNG